MNASPLSYSGSARAELNARKGEWPTMCKELGLSYWWITKFAQGRIAEAGVSKIERLHAYFDAHPRVPGQPITTGIQQAAGPQAVVQ